MLQFAPLGKLLDGREQLYKNAEASILKIVKCYAVIMLVAPMCMHLRIPLTNIIKLIQSPSSFVYDRQFPLAME